MRYREEGQCPNEGGVFVYQLTLVLRVWASTSCPYHICYCLCPCEDRVRGCKLTCLLFYLDLLSLFTAIYLAFILQ